MATIVIKRPEDHEMCPVGYHVVRGHERTCRSGTKTWVDAHNAKNPARNKTVLLKENIHYLYWNANLEAYGSLKGIKGFPDHHEIDAAILFWLAYWQSQGLKFPADFDPLIVKALIAAESSFDPEAGSRISSATGLTQILNTTRLDLAGRKVRGSRVVSNQMISVSQADLKDPIVNVAAGKGPSDQDR